VPALQQHLIAADGDRLVDLPEQLVEPNESMAQKLVTVTPFRKGTFSTHSSDPEHVIPPSYKPLPFVSLKIMANEGLAVLKKTPYEELNCPDPTEFSLTVVPYDWV